VLQHQVKAFVRAFADVSLNVRETPMATLPGLIAEGRFDIGYVRSPMSLPEGVDAVRLNTEGFVLAMADDSWLCRLKNIGAEHLQNETFVLPEQISGTLQVATQVGYAP
ncbi:LysR family transcriptional regulator, partial [Pseudomonas gingeri]|uniref:LysR substrate-binding domain-containing protein n=1 Tax=Pseudomonas gingeri TaxID=117681 RepID=UPI0017C19B7B